MLCIYIYNYIFVYLILYIGMFYIYILVIMYLFTYLISLFMWLFSKLFMTNYLCLFNCFWWYSCFIMILYSEDFWVRDLECEATLGDCDVFWFGRYWQMPVYVTHFESMRPHGLDNYTAISAQGHQASEASHSVSLIKEQPSVYWWLGRCMAVRGGLHESFQRSTMRAPWDTVGGKTFSQASVPHVTHSTWLSLLDLAKARAFQQKICSLLEAAGMRNSVQGQACTQCKGDKGVIPNDSKDVWKALRSLARHMLRAPSRAIVTAKGWTFGCEDLCRSVKLGGGQDGPRLCREPWIASQGKVLAVGPGSWEGDRGHRVDDLKRPEERICCKRERLERLLKAFLEAFLEAFLGFRRWRGLQLASILGTWHLAAPSPNARGERTRPMNSMFIPCYSDQVIPLGTVFFTSWS